MSETEEFVTGLILVGYLSAMIYIAWVCIRKRNAVGAWALIGVFFSVGPGMIIPVGLIFLPWAIRIAKPDSKWARNRYVGTPSGERKMAIARQRFPHLAPS
jgi:hypothetical protein